MKKILKLSLVIIILLVFIVGGMLIYLTRGLDAVSQQVTTDVNLSLLADGVYLGKYDGGRWSNQIEVEIKNQQIRKITIVKDVMFSKPEVSEQLFENVIERQSLYVDVVSGATVTSKAYLKSMEIALIN